MIILMHGLVRCHAIGCIMHLAFRRCQHLPRAFATSDVHLLNHGPDGNRSALQYTKVPGRHSEPAALS
jgi:hypothetical protein